KLLQPDPAQRSILYPVTPTLSVEAPQERSTSPPEIAVVDNVPGCVGAVTSGVEAEEVFEYVLRLPAASGGRSVGVGRGGGVVGGEVVGAVWVELVQGVAAERSILYPVTPTLSVDAPQDRSTSLPEIAVVDNVPGCVGAVTSGVEAEEVFEYVLRLPAA